MLYWITNEKQGDERKMKLTIRRGPYIMSVLYGVSFALLGIFGCIFIIPVILILSVNILILGLAGFVSKKKSIYVLKLTNGYYGGKDPATGFIQTVGKDDAIVFTEGLAKIKAKAIGAKIEEA